MIDEDDDPMEADGIEDEDVAAADEAFRELPQLRSRDYPAGHRQPRSTPPPASSGTSPWVGRPREGFTQSQSQRAIEMGNTRQGRSVKGLGGTIVG